MLLPLILAPMWEALGSGIVIQERALMCIVSRMSGRVSHIWDLACELSNKLLIFEPFSRSLSVSVVL